ncbi:hypothetical protein RRG08_021493 [Elysia crispata]|uniref:Uncharacterized protein n=1 Tax=Elysia crispata TaxID=231223 RepID=A0AAE1EDY5_9GAST|nr:hypothetical protein RRG08_021493 [Elysia crispata]
MGKKNRDTSATGTRRDSELGATYFPFLGPSPLDIQDTSFCGSGRPPYQPSGSGVVSGHRSGINRRDADSVHSLPSETAEDNVISVPMGSRPYREAQSLVLVASPFPPFCPPGFTSFVPPMTGPLLRYPTTDGYNLFQTRKSRPYHQMQYLSLRRMVIFMAGLFLLALVAAIFSAVYFGHKLDSEYA